MSSVPETLILPVPKMLFAFRSIPPSPTIPVNPSAKLPLPICVPSIVAGLNAPLITTTSG